MNLTTVWISGLAISLFAAAIAVRATQKPDVDPEGWRRLPPAVPTRVIRPEESPLEDAARRGRLRDLEGIYERAVRKDERAKREAAEALTDMRNAQSELAGTRESDDIVRTHWERSYRSANLRYTSAAHERRKALRSIDGVRRALSDQMGGSPSRVSLDSSK